MAIAMSEASQRRQPRHFQPPPWEEVPQVSEPKHSGSDGDVPPKNMAMGDTIKEEEKAPTDAPAVKEKANAEDPRLAELFARFSAEEASPNRQLWKVGALSALLLGSIGTMMLVWGAVATARTAQAGAAGMTGGAILVGFGMSFIGFSVWVIVRSLKQRGER